MEFKPESQWKVGLSVFKKGKGKEDRKRFRAGQIIYKGKTLVRESNEQGNQVMVPKHKFLVRVGKIAASTVVGTTNDALAALYRLLAQNSTGTLVKDSRETLDAFVAIPTSRAGSARVSRKRPSRSTEGISRTTSFRPSVARHSRGSRRRTSKGS